MRKTSFFCSNYESGKPGGGHEESGANQEMKMARQPPKIEEEREMEEGVLVFRAPPIGEKYYPTNTNDTHLRKLVVPPTPVGGRH